MNNKSGNILEIHDLVTAFDGRTIHEHLSLNVIQGEVLVILGGSGTGKTTLLRTLVGLETPVAGACLFEGRNIWQAPPKEWPSIRIKIAYAFQGGALFDSLTVRENLEFPLREHTRLSRKERRQKVREQLQELGLHDSEELLPAALSGGMQKRVGVARAIILDPSIILYDEPTAGLDPENVGRINDTIKRLQQRGKTSIVVTHDPSCALEVADRFAFIADGKIAAEQTLADYRVNPHPRLAAYFDGIHPHVQRRSTQQGAYQ